MYLKNFIRLLLVLFPAVTFAQEPVPVSASVEWGWSALTAMSMILIVVALYALSKAIDSLVDRVREKTRS